MKNEQIGIFISVSNAGINALKSLDFPQVIPFLVASPEDERVVLSKMVQWVPQCQLIFLDLMGVSESFARSLASILVDYQGCLVYAHGDHLELHKKSQLGCLRALQQSPRAEQKYRRAILQRMGKKGTPFSPGRLRDLRNEQWLCSYWKIGTSESISQMLVLLAKEYGFWTYEGDFFEPIDMDIPRIQWPEDHDRWENWEDYVHANPHASGAFHVVLLYAPHRYPQDTHPIVRALGQAFLKFGFYVTPLAAPRIQVHHLECIQACLPPTPDVLVNLLSFRLGQGPTSGDAQVALDFLRQLNIPHLHPFILGKRSISQWQEDPHGTTPAEFLLSIYLPEMDGAIETIPIAALDDSNHPPQLALIADRALKVVQRAKNWATLRHKPNEKKRLAILLYDYPPGEGRLGQAAFLDTTESLSFLLKYLNSKGYCCPTPTASELREYLPQLAAIVSETPPIHPCTQATTRRWGDFPGTIYSKDQGVALPGWLTDNVFLTLQPPRKQGVVSARDYHHEDLEPHHQYLAMYHYIANEFKADAMIHIGTHGTLEFTPGKENAPSTECFPDYLVGNIPHVYVYYSGNPSEAMIAKRRSHAVLVGHAQAPMAPGGLYGAMLELDVLLQEYAQAGSLNPSRQTEINHDIVKAAHSLGWNQNDPDALHERLNEMKQSLIPTRLHTLGQGYSDEEANQFATFYQSTHPEIHGNQLVQIKELLIRNNELESVGRVLAGGYLEAGLAGDPFRNLEVIPSGRNLVQMDPRHIPSPAAERNGRAMAEKNAMAYKLEHGVWPRNVAVILWGLETSKTQGESVAMILQYLGVRLRRPSPWKMDLECIPMGELGRPRIDVQVQISGFLRDLFPSVIHLIDAAVELVTLKNETFEENPIAQRTAEIEMQLRNSGYSSEEAFDLSKARVFGPKPGLYGTAVNGMIKNAEWQQNQELADAYLFSMRYVYTRQRMGDAQPKLLRKALRDVELVSQVRGGQDYEVTDLDHYYEFLGGIQNSIVALGGANPMMRICDSLGGGLRSEDLAHSIQRGVRSRLLNPLWQDGMLKSEFHGAQQFAERMENLLGLSALTGSVDSSLWIDVAQNLVLDSSMRERLQQNNPMAARQVAEKILETIQRGLWEAPQELTEQIQDVLMEMDE